MRHIGNRDPVAAKPVSITYLPVTGSCPPNRRTWHIPPRCPMPVNSLLVASSVSMVALAARRRQAPLTPVTRRGRFPAEGAATRNPRIKSLLFRVSRSAG